MTNLQWKRVLITGVWYKKLWFVFKDITTGEPSHTPLFIDGEEYKVNIGASIAMECARAGAVVHIVSRTETKLLEIKKWIETEVSWAIVEYSAINLSDITEMTNKINNIKNDLPLYRVQSVWLWAGTVILKDDNPYLKIDDLGEDLVKAELSVLENTIALLQILLPRFRKQAESRVCIISSMSAIRSVISGSMHMAAKGAISRFTNAAMIELDKEKIFISDIRPWGVDTGMYDTNIVQETVVNMHKDYGYHYQKEDLRFMPPSVVGEIVAQILSSKWHVTSVNIVARGQRPHEGS